MKTCTKCKQEKPLSDFDKTYQKGYPEQLRSDCKTCVNKRRREGLSKEQKRKRAASRNNSNVKEPVRFMLYDAKRRASRNNIPFDITPEDIPMPTHCPILGTLLKRGSYHVCPSSPTLDKYNPSLGYVKGNVTVISHRANTMKLDATTEEVYKLYLWMVEQDKQKDNTNDSKLKRTFGRS
jgi:hypothetical protein